MNQAEYLENFKKITEHMYDITYRKNTDYTGADASDPFKNFRAIEEMGVATVEQGFFARMTDKIMRIAGFIKNGVFLVADEKIEDTLMDLAIYCIIFICYLRDKRVEKGYASDSSTHVPLGVCGQPIID